MSQSSGIGNFKNFFLIKFSLLTLQIPTKYKAIFLLFIYSHVHTLFGSFLPPASAPTLFPPPLPLQAEPVLSFSSVPLKRRNKQ
jgi:hypothetical protein